MFNKQIHSKKSVTLFLGLILGTVLSLTALAATNLVQDRRVSMKEAREYAHNAKLKSNFPIVVNELVLQELNRYQNRPQSENKSWGAGLWMFIESTARNYGLRVDKLGYNIGENKVQEGINKLGNRDAWYLARHGYDGDKYLTRIFAWNLLGICLEFVTPIVLTTDSKFKVTFMF